MTKLVILVVVIMSLSACSRRVVKPRDMPPVACSGDLYRCNPCDRAKHGSDVQHDYRCLAKSYE